MKRGVIIGIATLVTFLVLYLANCIDAQDSLPQKNSIYIPLTSGTFFINPSEISIEIGNDTITMRGKKGIVTIYPDSGKVTRQNCDPDDAAEIFWKAVDKFRKMYPSETQTTEKPKP